MFGDRHGGADPEYEFAGEDPEEYEPTCDCGSPAEASGLCTDCEREALNDARPVCPECGKHMTDKDRQAFESVGGVGFPAICEACVEWDVKP